MLSGKRSATVRTLASFGVIAAMGMASQAYAQTPPQTPAPQTPAAQTPAPPAEADAMLFKSSAAMMVYAVKPDKIADFELFWTTVRSKIAASTKEDVKAAFAALKVYKVQTDAASAAQGATYIFYADPAAKVSYNPRFLLYFSGIFERAEADELFPKIQGSITTIAPWPLEKFGG